MFFLVFQCNWRFFTYEKKCRKSHGCTQKANTFFPRVNKNQKQKNSLSIGWYFHIFQIFSIVLLNFIFEKVGWLQNMKSNFNVFFSFYINFFIVIFTIYTFFLVEFHIRKRWLITEYEIDFFKFFPSFFRYFLLTFSPFKNMF